MRRAARLLAPLMVVIAATGCARHGYKLYPGPARPASELARLTTAACTAFQVDGLRVTRADYQFVELAPGRHEISWRSDLGTSWGETRDHREEASAAVVADLGAGQEYSVHCYVEYSGWGFGTEVVRLDLWVEHDGTGAVVAGEKP